MRARIKKAAHRVYMRAFRSNAVFFQGETAAKIIELTQRMMRIAYSVEYLHEVNVSEAAILSLPAPRRVKRQIRDDAKALPKLRAQWLGEIAAKWPKWPV